MDEPGWPSIQNHLHVVDVDKGKVAYRECLVWALEVLTRAHAHGELAPVQLVEMQAKVLELQAHLTSLYHWQWQVMPFIYMHLISATTGAYMLLCAPAPDLGLPTCTCTCSCAHANACLCASACTCAMQVRGRQGVALHARRQLHLRRDHARLPAGHAHCMHCAASACTPTARPCPLGRLLGATPYPLWLHMPPFGQLGGYPRAAPLPPPGAAGEPLVELRAHT